MYDTRYVCCVVPSFCVVLRWLRGGQSLKKCLLGLPLIIHHVRSCHAWALGLNCLSHGDIAWTPPPTNSKYYVRRTWYVICSKIVAGYGFLSNSQLVVVSIDHQSQTRINQCINRFIVRVSNRQSRHPRRIVIHR